MPASNFTVEAQLRFKADASQASSGVKALTGDVQRLDRTAKDAQNSLARMSAADRAASGVYGVAAPPAGAGRAQAFAGSDRRGMPTYQPGAAPYSPPMPGGAPSNPAADAAGAALLGGRALAIGTALVAAVGALDRFTRALDRAAVEIDPSGQRLRRGVAPSIAQGVNEIPLVGNVWRGALSGLDYTLNFEGRYQANEDAFQAEKRLRQLGPQADAQRQVDELRFRQRAGQMSALGSAQAAANLRRGFGGYAAQYLKNEPDPALAEAMMASDIARGALTGARTADVRAGEDVGAARERVAAARGRLSVAQRSVSDLDAQHAGTGIPSADYGAARDRANVLQAEKALEMELERLKEALNRQEQTGVDLAQKKLDAKRAELAVDQAKLAAVDREIAKQKEGAVQLSLMSSTDRQGLLDLARRAKAGGFGNLSPEERQALLGNVLTAEFARAELVKLMQSDPVFTQLQELLGGQNLGQLQAERERLINVILTAKIDEQALAQQAAQIAEKIVPEIIKVIEEQTKGKLRQIELERGAQQQQQQG